jgi:hypothetical protein
MKLKYTIVALFATLAVVAGCKMEGDTYLENVQVDKSYVAISPDGGSATIEVSATQDWTFSVEIPQQKEYTDAKKGKVTETYYEDQLEVYDWISVTPKSGNAGTTKVTISATNSEGNSRSETILLKAGDQVQRIIVSQSSSAEIPLSTVEDVMNGPDSKTFKVTGVCTSISSTLYGNWYLKDDSYDKTLYIYGTVDAAGAYNWSSFGIEVGDVVTVQGPKTTYNGTVELVDVSVIKVTKALLAVKSQEKVITKEAGTFTFDVTQKGKGLYFESDNDWLTVADGYAIDGTKATFTLYATENTTGKNRKGVVTFKSTDGDKSSEVPVTFIQLAETTNGTVSNIRNTIAPGSSSKRVSFDYTISKATVTYKNGSNIFLEDENGGLLIYSSEVKLNVGQTVTGRVFGEGYAYNSLPEATAFNMALAKVTDAPKDKAKLPQPTEVTLAELLDNWDKYFCRLVTIKGLSVTDPIEATYEVVDPETGKKTSGDRSGRLSDGTKEIAAYVQVKEYVLMESGKKYNVTCIPTVNKSTKQLGIWGGSFVEEVK